MKRLITGLLFGGCWVLLLVFGSFQQLFLAVAALYQIAFYEYLRLALEKPGKTLVAVAMLSGSLPVLAAFAGRVDAVGAGLVLALLLLIAVILLIYSSLPDGLKVMSSLGFGILYLGFCSAHFILLRKLPQGNYWLLVLTAIIAGSDTGAYYVGRWLGRTRLCPAVSPGKTWEGAAGGLLFGTAGGLTAVYYLFPMVSLYKFTLAALLIVATGIAGDLTESIMKRASGVKDSGRLLAGHGGLLDRCDSILLSAPVFFYLLHFGLLG